MTDDEEPRIEIQARICPICIDDHLADRDCLHADLIDRIKSLNKEIGELKAKVQELELDIVAIPVGHAELVRECGRLMTELNCAVTALQFYADHHWYEKKTYSEVGSGKTWDPPFSIRNDHGQLARKTLEKLRQK